MMRKFKPFERGLTLGARCWQARIFGAPPSEKASQCQTLCDSLSKHSMWHIDGTIRDRESHTLWTTPRRASS